MRVWFVWLCVCLLGCLLACSFVRLFVCLPLCAELKLALLAALDLRPRFTLHPCMQLDAFLLTAQRRNVQQESRMGNTGQSVTKNCARDLPMAPPNIVGSEFVCLWGTPLLGWFFLKGQSKGRLPFSRGGGGGTPCVVGVWLDIKRTPAIFGGVNPAWPHVTSVISALIASRRRSPTSTSWPGPRELESWP